MSCCKRSRKTSSCVQHGTTMYAPRAVARPCTMPPSFPMPLPHLPPPRCSLLQMRTALAQATSTQAFESATAVVPAPTRSNAVAPVSQPGSGQVLAATNDGNGHGREYVVTGSPGTTVRVNRAGSIRINLPAGRADAPVTAGRGAVGAGRVLAGGRQHTRFAPVPEHDSAAGAGAGVRQSRSTRTRYSSTTTRTSTTAAAATTGASSRLRHPQRPSGTAARGAGAGAGGDRPGAASTSQLAPFASAPNSGAVRASPLCGACSLSPRRVACTCCSDLVCTRIPCGWPMLVVHVHGGTGTAARTPAKHARSVRGAAKVGCEVTHLTDQTCWPPYHARV